MFTNPTFWFLVSFLIFFILFGKTIWTMIASGLDSHSNTIERDIKEAMEIKEQAQQMLNEIKRKSLDADKHAEAILQHAHVEAERLRSEAAKELDECLSHRDSLVEQRIRFAEQEALKDIRDTAVRMAIEAADKILHNVVSKDIDARLSDNAINELSGLHTK